MGPYKTHDADIVVAWGGGRSPQTPPLFFFEPRSGLRGKVGGGFSKCAESDLANEGACSRFLLRGRVKDM